MYGRGKKSYQITLAVIVAGFALLTLFIYLYPASSLDIEFSREVQLHQNKTLDVLMRAVSWFGYMPNSIITVFFAALLFFILNYKREAKFILLTLLSGGVSSALKLMVNRPRPTSDLVKILEKTREQSFPSGHVLFYVTFFGMLVLIIRENKALKPVFRNGINTFLLFLIFSIPLSRIYLGAHWFTDVLAGFIAGLFCLAVLGYFYLSDEKS